MLHRSVKIFSTSALTFLLVACGFQLRGSVSIPSELHQMSVNCAIEMSKVLCQTLNKQLELNGVNLIKNDDADYILSVANLASSKRTISITGRGVAAEYDVTNTATFNLVASDQTVIIDDTKVSSSETYRNDENAVISKSREELQLKERLNKQLASKIVSRLSPYNTLRINEIRAAQKTNQ